MTSLAPRPYQEEGSDFLAGKRIGLLADEMRVGKTCQAIIAAYKVKAEKLLVVCPAIAVPMWRYQIPSWYHALDAEPPMHAVMSFEKALIHQAQVRSEPWSAAIIDECHFAGNPEAKRTKMIYGKDGIAWNSGHLWALSGTPAPKHGGSLWPILRAAGVTKLSYYDFLRYFCRIDYLSQRPVGTRVERIDELRALWQQIGLRRTRAQVAPEVPDIDYEFLEVSIDADLDLDLAGASNEALLAKLEQASATNREDRIATANAKAERLIEELEFALGNQLLKQTVVFGWHLEPLRKMHSCLQTMGFRVKLLIGETPVAERARIEVAFREGRLDVVLGQIRACGTAIDLSAARHGYFLELDWVPTNNAQAANRLVSLGKSDKVTMDVCTMPGSVDDRVQRVLLQRARELGKLF